MAQTAPLPTGVVTFAFTDIEGSTARWQRDRAAMQDAVQRHDAILHTAVTEHGGRVFKTIGDAFCAAFTRPEDAVAAMYAAQQVLAAEDFSAVDGLRVRMALHSGTTDQRDGDYFGPALNHVGRLLAVGHRNQVLVSSATRALVRGDLPAGATLLDLGSHRLRDLAEPERVWQLDIAGFANEFPPLRTLDALPNNLPQHRTTFIGREHEVAKVKELLDHHRLLTLVGSGGVGKTRLAVQVGAELLDRFPDGVWFVDLAPISDPELVASVAALAIGMSQQQGQRVDEAIPKWLTRKKVLLIFDNCEHVLEPIAALAAAILAMDADVRILATSRQALNVSGEAAHSLPSLAVPNETAGLKSDEAVQYGAIALFYDRAIAADARFALTDNNAPIVAEICRRLDGIALAIELAAARVKILSIPNLAQRLNERFRLLTGGSRDALPRQKTLIALIDWSYDLLTPQEQTVFKRLGIFAGGFDLDAATVVCSGDAVDDEVFDVLTSLTDKSLVVIDTGGETARYRLLESTAAYSLEKLAALGERERTARRHAEYFREQAETLYRRRDTHARIGLLAESRLEIDNYRAALEWALSRDDDAVVGGAIASALKVLWEAGGLGVEGRYWSERALLRISEAEQPAIAARLYFLLGSLVSGKRKYDASQQALRLYEVVGDRSAAARAQQNVAWALYQMGRLDEAREAAVRALAASRACGDEYGERTSLDALAGFEWSRGDFGAARELYAQVLARRKTLGDKPGSGVALGNMAELEFAAGNPAQALRLAGEALEIALRDKNLSDIAVDRNNITAYRIALGDQEGAGTSAREGLRAALQSQNEQWIAIALQHLALLAVTGGDPRRGARLRGYVDTRYDQLEMQRESTEQQEYDNLLSTLHDSLSEDEVTKLAAEGARWSEDLAVAEALKV